MPPIENKNKLRSTLLCMKIEQWSLHFLVSQTKASYKETSFGWQTRQPDLNTLALSRSSQVQVWTAHTFLQFSPAGLCGPRVLECVMTLSSAYICNFCASSFKCNGHTDAGVRGDSQAQWICRNTFLLKQWTGLTITFKLRWNKIYQLHCVQYYCTYHTRHC